MAKFTDRLKGTGVADSIGVFVEVGGIGAMVGVSSALAMAVS